jgi:hypothetical protein
MEKFIDFMELLAKLNSHWMQNSTLNYLSKKMMGGVHIVGNGSQSKMHRIKNSGKGIIIVFHYSIFWWTLPDHVSNRKSIFSSYFKWMNEWASFNTTLKWKF